MAYIRIPHLFKRTFPIKKWCDFDRLQQATLYLVQGAKRLFIPTKLPQSKKEAFETVVKKFNVTTKHLDTQARALRWWGRLLCISGLGVAGWGVYHMSHSSFRASLISFIIMGIAFVLAFRYHFFAFQIQQRKLGCTFKEWVQYGLFRRKP